MGGAAPLAGLVGLREAKGNIFVFSNFCSVDVFYVFCVILFFCIFFGKNIFNGVIRGKQIFDYGPIYLESRMKIQPRFLNH